MSEKHSRGLWIVFVETPAIPDPDACVVTAWVKQMRRFIDKSDAVDVCHDVVLSHRHAKCSLVPVAIKDVHTRVCSTADNLATVVGEGKWKSTESIDIYVKVQAANILVIAVQRANVETLSPRGVRKILWAGTERNVEYAPADMLCCDVVEFFVIRRRRVENPNFLVLTSGDETISVASKAAAKHFWIESYKRTFALIGQIKVVDFTLFAAVERSAVLSVVDELC